MNAPRHRHRCEASCPEGATFIVDGRPMCDTHAAHALGVKAERERIRRLIVPCKGIFEAFCDESKACGWCDRGRDLLTVIDGPA